MADYSIEVAIPNVGPQGIQGVPGPANEITLGTVTTGDEGTEATATITGTPPEQTLDLTIPRGDTGLQGTTGNAGPTGAGGAGVVPPAIYATMQAAVEGGITFGGVYRHTSESVYWVEEPDPDAAAFIASSGATDVWNIQKFVQGVKALGLYDDMVCWPLRSAQNAGSGTTAYSLGGLGTFNGTLVNGPTWGVDGVTKANAAERINIGETNSSLRGALSVFACFKSSAAADNQRVFNCQDGSASSNYWQLDLSLNVVKRLHVATTRNNVNASTTDADPTGRETLFNYWGAALASTSAHGFTNGTAAAEQTGLAARNATGTPNVDMIGTPGAANARGTLSFAVALTPTLTSAQMSSIYSLYKTTLGLGLSLP